MKPSDEDLGDDEMINSSLNDHLFKQITFFNKHQVKEMSRW